MARISVYPLDTSISADDSLVGTDAEDSNITKNFSVGDLKAFISNGSTLPYTSLVQLLNQTGTNAPVATEVYNNTGQTFTWSYVGIGIYRVTSTGASFTVDKTIVFLNNGSVGSSFFEPRWNRINDTTIEVVNGSNSSMVNGSFEVKIYN
jgi:hypothetical protein